MDAAEHFTAGIVNSPAGPAGPVPAIDFEELFERCLGNVTFLLSFCGVFQDQVALDMARIDEALGAGDFDELSHVAHRLRGSAAYLSADAVRSCAQRLENAAAERDIDQAADAVAQLGGALATCLAQLAILREQAALMASGAPEPSIAALDEARNAPDATGDDRAGRREQGA
jgi:HPt (histidine-containing phosphotransfer) domain-containing protein